MTLSHPLTAPLLSRHCGHNPLSGGSFTGNSNPQPHNNDGNDSI